MKLGMVYCRECAVSHPPGEHVRGHGKAVRNVSRAAEGSGEGTEAAVAVAGPKGSKPDQEAKGTRKGHAKRAGYGGESAEEVLKRIRKNRAERQARWRAKSKGYK